MSASSSNPHIRPAAAISADVEAVGRIEAVKTVLRVLTRTTGLRLAVVARVTPESWTCCAVLDEMGFGLRAGDTLVVSTTFCNTVRGLGAPLLVNHASRDPRFKDHPAPKMYGIESYVAVPLYRRNGDFFGVMCALDANAADLTEGTLEIFRHLGDLVGHQLEQEEVLNERDSQLLGAREASVLREQLMGIVSHDLRNPLNAISLAAATLMRRTDLDDRARRGLRRILDSSDRANRLIRDLLDFTHVRTGMPLPVKPQPMDLHELAEQVVDEVRLTAHGCSLDLVCEGSGRGSWDPDRIAQVLTNLLTNAVQYSAPGAHIRVEARGDAREVVLAVTNLGTPIPPELLPVLFEPMTRGTTEGSEHRSVGLGLFIVNQIVRAHGGAVDVVSTEEAGTTFQVHLPRGC
ncbi:MULTISPECIES: GAF domain-containing sensor histidine kinase [unclassified Corallococcus]|uniref:GAF domain-containing sensor histidine kinase n=1 Tax=unclassified Corallococcus TaxID=2685029 RepID=UPI001A90966E|nr:MULTISPECIES: GAF domain-containing sensor histidine kinase [unclassified Corallococcus]MBN9681084.1 GAF domain-containing sensor histidine kinase [Corallococcus sp. NCSPR001]WAS87322.1 GAF domain-containing sensor histidine kinase [Corallococcus sp. NCRR]